MTCTCRSLACSCSLGVTAKTQKTLITVVTVKMCNALLSLLFISIVILLSVFYHYSMISCACDFLALYPPPISHIDDIIKYHPLS